MVEDKLMMKFTKFLLILGYLPNMNLTKLNLQIEQVFKQVRRAVQEAKIHMNSLASGAS